MKKYLTISNLLKCVAVVLGIVAFCLMFGDQVYYQESFRTLDPITDVWVTSYDNYYISFSDAFFGSNVSFTGSVVGFIGYIIVLAAALVGVVGVCVSTKKGVVSVVLSGVVALLFIVGGILIFCTAAGVNGANDTNIFNLTACPIIAGVLALVSGIGYCVSAFLDI